MGKLIDFGKTILSATLIVLLIRGTGLLGDLSFITQSAAMEAGMLDAKVAAPLPQSDFDYNFTIKDLKGIKTPFSEFKGKVIFLNLWATWCGPCRAEMPTIEDLYNSSDKNNIAFVMLSLDKDQDKEKIVKYIQSKSYTFPAYQPSGYLSEQLRVDNIPTTFIISRDGKIAATYIGATKFNTLKFKKFIEGLVRRE